MTATDPRPSDELDDPEERKSDDSSVTGVRRARRRRSSARNAIEWVIVLVGALAVAFLVQAFAVKAFYIPSESMEPTLHIGDRVLVRKFGIDVADIDRGNIVVFERPATWGTGEIEDLIKRVIAEPGDTIENRDGVVFVNGNALTESYLGPGTITPPFFAESGCVPSCTMGPAQFFVLGDNRTNSDASNHYGPIEFSDIVGRASLRVWPLGNFGGL